MERKKRIYRHLKTLDEAGRILRGRFGKPAGRDGGGSRAGARSAGCLPGR